MKIIDFMIWTLKYIACVLIDVMIVLLNWMYRLIPYIYHTWKRALTVVIPLILIMLFTYQRQTLYVAAEIEDATISDEPNLTTESDFMRKSAECQKLHASFVKEGGAIYCNAIFDQVLCWPPTKAGDNVTQNCPPEVPFVDPENLAMRICGADGLWLDQNQRSSVTGWTNYISCFPPSVRDLLENMTKSKDSGAKFTVAGWIRSIEFVGITVSIIALISGIIIFKKFRTLINKRTKIHLHLFSALLCQCLLLLSIYIDQGTSRLMEKNDTGCKIVYSAVEFLTTHCFCFMLIEGLFLYCTISANALRPRLSYRTCLTFAYVFPILNTSVWIGFAISNYEIEGNVRCWFGYNLDKIFWILQGPRLIIIMINFMLLLGVLNILVNKLSQNRTSDMERVKKALRATLLLMPLLGITNFLSMTNGPVRDSTVTFALWALFAYVFRSFQGFMIVYIYCFRNAEVHDVLRKYVKSKRTARNCSVRRTNVTDTECEVFRRDGEASRLASLVPEADMIAPADAVSVLQPRRSSSDESDSEKNIEVIELTTFTKMTVKVDVEETPLE